MKRYLALVQGSTFLRHATLFTIGALLAQLVTLAATPYYTRHFTADIFAIQALFFMAVTCLTPIATGNYDWALPTIQSDHDASLLTSSTLTITIIVTTLLLILTILLQEPIITALHLEPVRHYIFVFPFLILAAGFNSVTNYWLLRRGKVKLQTANRAALPLLIVVFTLALGITHHPHGLMLGYFYGLFSSMLCSIALAWHYGLRFHINYKKNEQFQLLKRLHQFPLFSAIPTALNNLATQIPLLALSLNYSLTEAGHYTLARSILANGIATLTLSIGQAVLKHIADRESHGKPLWPYHCRMLLWLSLVGFLGAGLVFIFGPQFFTIYFGTGWEDSASITRILAVTMFFWFVGPTLSFAAVAIHRMKAIAAWQAIYCIAALSLLFFPHIPFHSFVNMIVVFEVVAYSLYIAMISYTIWRNCNSRA